MTFNSDHLTDLEFSNYLIEKSLSAAREAHVASCMQCQQELMAFGSSVSNFAAASQAFSDSLPVHSVRRATQQSFWRLAFAPAAWAAAAALVIAGSLPAWHLIHPAKSVATVYDSASQIASDNELMRSVDVALVANDTSPLDEFHITATTDVRGHLVARRRQ